MKLAGEIRSSGVAVTLVVHEHKRLGRGIELAMLAEELKASDVGLAPSDTRYRRQLFRVGCAADLVVRSAVRYGTLVGMRIDFDPQAMDATAFYRLLTAVVVPRPIAWVSTVSSADPCVANLAPAMF